MNFEMPTNEPYSHRWAKLLIFSFFCGGFSDEVQEKWINPTVYKEEEARSDVLTQVFTAVDKCRFTFS